MRPIKKSLLLFTVWFVLCSLWFMTVSYAGVPPLINYQGKLAKKADGTPETQTKNITFRIYDSSSGGIGNIKWQGTYSVTPDKGVFSVMLGDKNDAGYNFSTLPFDVQYWLGIQLEGDAEMTPLQPLASSAYAFNSARLDGKPATEFSLANHTHDANSITSGVLSTSRGGTGLTTSMVKTGSYTGNGISPRVIAHGLGTTPSVIMIMMQGTGYSGEYMGWWAMGMTQLCSTKEYNPYRVPISVDSNNFILSSSEYWNHPGEVWYWIAIKSN